MAKKVAVPEVDTIATYNTIKEGSDPFNGLVYLFEDYSLGTTPARYWAEHQRKDIYTDYLTLEAAEEKFTEFVADTQFA